MSLRNDRLVQELASRGSRPLTRIQFDFSGIDPRVLDRRAAAGWISRPLRAVYQLVGTPHDELHAIRAVAAAGGERGAISRRSALVLRGFWPQDPGFATVHFSTAPGLRLRRPGVRSHELRNFTEDDVVEVAGIRCLGWPRLLIEASTWMQPERLERTLDDAMLRGVVTLSDLQRRFNQINCSGSRGAGVLHDLLSARELTGTPKTHSVFEQRFARLLHDSAVPRPTQQFPVRDASNRVRLIDFAYPEQRVAIETDGWRYHASRHDWSADQSRNNDLVAMGWRILRVTVQDLEQRPAWTIASIQAALKSQGSVSSRP